MAYKDVHPFIGHFKKNTIYRGAWPLENQLKTNDSINLKWKKTTERAIKPKDIVLFKVLELEENKNTPTQVQLELMLHFTPLNLEKDKNLVKNIIEAAKPEALNRSFDLSLYDIQASEDLSISDGVFFPKYIVSFIEKNAPKNVLGNPGKIPGLEVHIEHKTLRVIKAHYIR